MLLSFSFIAVRVVAQVVGIGDFNNFKHDWCSDIFSRKFAKVIKDVVLLVSESRFFSTANKMELNKLKKSYFRTKNKKDKRENTNYYRKAIYNK